MEIEVLKPGYTMLPYFTVFNEEGVKVFAAVDLDPDWRGRPRLQGRYLSVAWVPGNLFAEGRLFVGVSLKTTAQRKQTYYFRESEVVAFQVIDSLDGDSARGDYTGGMRGAIRPLLRWETKFFPDGQKPVSTLLE
jgi:lipopolysaccharide transport system ATP-binding protein